MSNKFMSKVKALCKKAKDTLEAKTAVMKANCQVQPKPFYRSQS